MKLPRIAITLGTRPEAIKMAPIIRVFREHHQEFETLVVATAQHRQMLDQVLRLFQIVPDLDLDLMQPNQTLSELTYRTLEEMSATLKKIQPDLLLVQGDTTTVFAAALAAFFQKVPVAHVEAGLRSHDIYNPFPEEVNRHLTTVLAEIHLAPTSLARQKLLSEGVEPARIVVTGNTVVDALTILNETPLALAPMLPLEVHQNGHRMLLVTSHRRESWGQDLENICGALKDLVARFPDLHVVYPVHLNPNVRETVTAALQGAERIHLLPPLDYATFFNLMRQSYLILTDSGGVQEEAPSLHKPCLVLRKVTERPEASQSGMAKIVGTAREEIVRETARLLTDRAAYRAMAEGENPYGDGRAAERIVEVVGRWSRQQSPLLEPEKEFRPLQNRSEVIGELCRN